MPDPVSHPHSFEMFIGLNSPGFTLIHPPMNEQYGLEEAKEGWQKPGALMLANRGKDGELRKTVQVPIAPPVTFCFASVVNYWSMASVHAQSRRKRSAAERREQQRRAESRSIQRLLGGLLNVESHRGN